VRTDPGSAITGMVIHDSLHARTLAWIGDDPDPACQAELRDLLAAGRWGDLDDRFSGLLQFGTAGLRGPIGAGPARMNRAVVARATAALCKHVRARVERAEQRGLCIGFDARTMSREFAQECAEIAAGAGFAVRLFAAPVPTPLLAFAVLDLGAAAGVMITASHNPASDNGYKVYWENGAQLLPPHDRAIAQEMSGIASVLGLPREGAEARREHAIGPELEERYLQAITAEPAQSAGRSPLRIAYTALHGVGERFARAALNRAGFSIESVAEQATPDPTFPTVAFPNPEEPGVMDRVAALAEALHADLALANDPDADRLAVMARDREGTLRPLTGNALGVLLADHVLRERTSQAQALVVSSIVSTPMLAAIARQHGAVWEPTLTGFKWICNRALQLEQERGLEFVFGFEEALGYCVGSRVHDKDGISSAVVVARMADALRRAGLTLHDQLELLFRTHGLYMSGQVALRVDGPDGLERIASWMADLRARPPRELAGHALEASLDLRDGTAMGVPSFRPDLPESDVLLWELHGGHRVMLRPSGTEPKLKVYVDVREPLSAGESMAAAEGRARAALADLSAALRVLCA
jgi:phosphomannomutase